jgi:hypothetical protein
VIFEERASLLLIGAVLPQLPYVFPKESAMVKQWGSEALLPLMFHVELQKEQE